METAEQEDSILGVLKSSIDHVWTVRKKPAAFHKRLEIQMSSSYILKDRSLDCSNTLTVIPEVCEEQLPNEQAGCSKFFTKIEFIKPNQCHSEDSPISVKSQSSDSHESPRKLEKKSVTRDRFSLGSSAREEIKSLRQNKERLQGKIANLKQSLDKLQQFQQENDTRKSLELKLQKLEKQQIVPEQDTRLSEAASKVQNLESEIKRLRHLKDFSIVRYEEELGTIYHKLKDLQECNAILTEILACFKKEPLLLSPSREVTFSPGKNVLNTIQLEKHGEKSLALNQNYAIQEQLFRNKERLEAELRDIPENSRSLSSKRKRLYIEYELSINSSKIASLDEKIKRSSCL